MITRFLNKAGLALMAISIFSAAVIPAASVFAFNPSASVLDIDGSTTVFPVVRIAQQQFPIDFPTTVNVTSTGSGHGQVSIMNTYVDIGMSSSACGTGNQYIPTSGAFTTAAYVTSGVVSPNLCTALTDTVVARDGLTITVNVAKLACITDISKADIAGIYAGTITNWSAITGSTCASETIVPRARIVGSGTRQSLLDLVGAPLTTANEQTTITATGLPRLLENADLEAVIAANPNQIGYGGMINVDPAVKSLTVAGIAGNVTNVANGTYPLSRNLHLFTLPTALNNKTRITDFLNWILSPKGQATIVNEGYVAVAQAAPNWDIDVNHAVNVLDLTSVGGYWGQTGPLTGDAAPLPIYVRGWVRADVNFDGKVSVLDLTTVGGHWGQAAGGW